VAAAAGAAERVGAPVHAVHRAVIEAVRAAVRRAPVGGVEAAALEGGLLVGEQLLEGLRGVPAAGVGAVVLGLDRKGELVVKLGVLVMRWDGMVTREALFKPAATTVVASNQRTSAPCPGICVAPHPAPDAAAQRDGALGQRDRLQRARGAAGAVAGRDQIVMQREVGLGCGGGVSGVEIEGRVEWIA